MAEEKQIKLPEGFVSPDEGDPAEDGFYIGYFVLDDETEFTAEIQYRAEVGFLHDCPEAELVGWRQKYPRKPFPCPRRQFS